VYLLTILTNRQIFFRWWVENKTAWNLSK